MRLLAKIGLLSYGYLMGILWVSYGKGRERIGKSPQNCIFYGVENRDNTFISVYLGICRVYLFFIQTIAYVIFFDYLCSRFYPIKNHLCTIKSFNNYENQSLLTRHIHDRRRFSMNVNANVDVQASGKIQLLYSGTLYLKQFGNLNVRPGAETDIEYGRILLQ